MKGLYFVLLIFCYSNVYSQTIPIVNPDESNLNFKEEVFGNNLNSNQSKSFDDFPFEIGIEGGIPIKIFGKSFFTSGITGFVNINLSKKLLFFKIEFGKLWLNSDLQDNTSTYSAFSITGQIIKISKISNILIDVGYGISSSENYFNGGFKLGVTYKQSLSKLTSLMISLKMPFINEPRNNEFYFNPFLTVGVQFF
ncbi:MAG: hypothetical protein WAT71_06020 [Ignavibacteria bacterium]